MKKVLRATLSLIVIVLGLGVILFAVLWFTEWKPARVEVVAENSEAAVVSVGDTLTIVSWNIGYAGLGDDMDFFYDGGQQVRGTQERTDANFEAIMDFLGFYRGSADFVLLQEVDFDSKRSFYVNQFEQLADLMSGYEGVYAYNYVSPYVPIPVGDPIGKVKSGVVTFSKYPIAKAVRYQYPSEFAFPMSMFNLKRCMLEVSILMTCGDTLVINNTHNTAFDTGGMRAQELAFMSAHLAGERYSFTAGDFNSNPPGYDASRAELEDKFFSPISVGVDDFPSDMTFAADLEVASMRYNNEPYVRGRTITSILDFGILGAGFELVDVETIDLGFSNSDHNPVVYRIVFRK